MGCDIHLIVQQKINDAWVDVPAPPLAWQDEWQRKYKWWYRDRNYDAFAILANVRNGEGFGGCDTGDALIPISQPRGFPRDFEYIEDESHVWLGDHSFTWLLLSELEAYPHWDRTRNVRGLVNSVEMKGEPSLNNGPASYCSDAGGANIRKMTAEDWRAQGRPKSKDIYVQMSWPETYSHSAGRFYSKFMPSLIEWADKNGVNHNDVRLVMGFDS